MSGFDFDELKAEYDQDIANYKPTRSSEAIATAKRLLPNKARFLAVQQVTGVPALWLMPVFERENPSFNSYFGNGDPLHSVTVDVPKGRGPFNTWEDGAIDALRLDDMDDVHDWSWPMACYQWEKWNGFGPRRHGKPTGYVWSGTNIYQGGKYVADGVWSRGTWDKQLGTFIIARALSEADPSLTMA